MHRWLVWNFLFPVQEWIKGHPTLRILKAMEAADRLTADELECLRATKLRKMLEYGYAQVPYVRSVMEGAGLTPSDIRSPSDLARLPVMRKADVRKHREQLRSRTAAKLVPFSTGGSTGQPLLFDLSRERIAAAIACRQRVMRWWGLSVGDREFAVWGSPVELTRQDRIRNFRDRLFATRLLSAFEMSETVMSQYLDLLADEYPRTIFGYPSSIYLLCLQAGKEKRDLRRLAVKTIFVTGEVLLPHQRELIMKTFDCQVANGYGGRDSGFIAHECPHGGMHVMADATVVEILSPDGQRLPENEPGEIVVTDLYSKEVPFLRYATGDIGALSSQTCPCGRPLPLLTQIEGRTTDFIRAPDGRVLHALSVIYILREMPGIEQFRIRQKEMSHFHVELVRAADYKLESESRIRDAFQRRMGAPVTVTFEYRPSLRPEPSGKFRYVISELVDSVPVKKTVVSEIEVR